MISMNTAFFVAVFLGAWGVAFVMHVLLFAMFDVHLEAATLAATSLAHAILGFLAKLLFPKNIEDD